MKVTASETVVYRLLPLPSGVRRSISVALRVLIADRATSTRLRRSVPQVTTGRRDHRAGAAKGKVTACFASSSLLADADPSLSFIERDTSMTKRTRAPLRQSFHEACTFCSVSWSGGERRMLGLKPSRSGLLSITAPVSPRPTRNAAALNSAPERHRS